MESAITDYRMRFVRVPLYTATIVVSAAGLVLLGWLLNVELLKRIAPMFVAMNPATAVAFVFAAISLFLQQPIITGQKSHRSRRWGACCAALAMLIGTLKLVEVMFGWEIGVDTLLFRDRLDDGGLTPNRMAPNTSLTLVLTGLALLLLGNPNSPSTLPQSLSLIVGLISWLALLGYAYGTSTLYGVASFIPMALHTALLFLLMAIGILCVRPTLGLMGIITHRGTGGQISRRVIPAIVLVPSVLGWLRLLGERRGLYEAETGVALMVAVSIGTCVGIILWAARSLNETDSRRMQAETEVHRLHEDLKLRAAELAYANRELESFSYSVSHDLRAPLRHVAGFVDLLRKDSADTLKDKSRRYVEIIADSAKQMGRLIDDLLEFSRTGRTSLNREEVNLDLLLGEVIQNLSSDIGDREITWDINQLPTVNGDRALLRQVWANLIGNALKYTRTQPRACIHVGLIDKPDEVVVFVRDNGVGFDMQYAAKLFGVFQRLHHADEFEGTGIGLANVRRIIERHGGKTWAEGAINEGATFYFSLPKKVPINDEPTKTHSIG